MIFAGISSSTTPPKEGVSSAPVSFTSTIFPSATVTSATISQNMPWALPVNTSPGTGALARL